VSKKYDEKSRVFMVVVAELKAARPFPDQGLLRMSQVRRSLQKALNIHGQLRFGNMAP